MELFKTYKLWDIEPVKGLGTTLWDKDGAEYTDLYGGHAVISIGHSHPHYVKMLSDQLTKLGFYSNAVQNSLQKELARRLGKISGYDNYSLFLCNSGAEANENAMKLASFHTGRSRILAFARSFHGRTSGAVAATDNPLNDLDAAGRELASGDYAGVMIEGIQGVAGIFEPSADFLVALKELCRKHGTLLILDEIQSGYGIVTMAKGMGNGFPIGGVVISPDIKAEYGMLGTTFGGNHLACTAALAVLDVIENEHLIENAARIGDYFSAAFHPGGKLHHALKEYRGKGLMIGLEIKEEHAGLRDRLLFDRHYFTGAAGASVIRLLPSLTVSQETAEGFVKAFDSLTC